LHRLPFVFQQFVADQQAFDAVGITVEHRVVAAAVMLHQRLQVALEELLGRLPEPVERLARFEQVRLDPLAVVLDQPRHLDTGQQAEGEQQQPQVTSEHAASLALAVRDAFAVPPQAHWPGS
jgi:hypothetical protein